MASDFENFKAWYSDTLLKLYSDHNSGFPILMIAFPLLERYLRHRCGLSYKESLNDKFMVELRNIFPAIPTIKDAWDFWNIYRNGILHQVTLSRKKFIRNRNSEIEMPEGWLSHKIESAISIEADGSYLVNPNLFAKLVVCEVEKNFPIFDKGSSDSTNLPKEKLHPTAKINIKGTQEIVLGTNTEL